MLTVALLLAGARAASAEGLFRPANLSAQEARTLRDNWRSQGLEIIRSTVLRADPAYVRSHIAPRYVEDRPAEPTPVERDRFGLPVRIVPGKDPSRARREAAAARLPFSLQISFFPDVSLRFRRDFSFSSAPGRFGWEGSSVDSHNCGASLIADHGVISGEVECADLNRSYYIAHIRGNLYRVYEVVRPRDMVGFCDTDDEEECRRQAEGLCKGLSRLGSSISRNDRRLRSELCN